MDDFGIADVNKARQWHPECEFLHRFVENFQHFIAIHTITGVDWKTIKDTYLIRPNAYAYNLPNLRKQEMLYQVGKTVTKCLMIGNGLCHSFLILLLSNPTLTIECLDADDLVVKYLNQKFGNRIRAYTGGSGYDLVHFDVDIRHTSEMLSKYLPHAEPGKYVMVNEHKQHFAVLREYIERGELIWVSSCESATVLSRNLQK